MRVAFRRSSHHPLHRWFGDGAVQDLRRLNGRFRAFLMGVSWRYRAHENAKDFPTFRGAAAELVAMHERYFAGLVWC